MLRCQRYSRTNWKTKSRNRARYKSEQCPPLPFRRISEALWLRRTAEGICGPHTAAQSTSMQDALHRSAALRGPGLLNLQLAPPPPRDVSRRESERRRERGGQKWETEFIQYYWDIYSLADRYGEPPIPAPVNDAALKHTLILTPLGGRCALCIPPSRVFRERA